MLQFLIESGTMALVGGFWACWAGSLLPKTVTAADRHAIGDQAVGGCCRPDRFRQRGIFFGVYPARNVRRARSHCCPAI